MASVFWLLRVGNSRLYRYLGVNYLVVKKISNFA